MSTRARRGFDALGKGVEEGKPAGGAARYVSKGLTRSRTDKLMVMPGGGGFSLTLPQGEGRPAKPAGVGHRAAPTSTPSPAAAHPRRSLRHRRAQGRARATPLAHRAARTAAPPLRAQRRARRRRREARRSQGQGLRRRGVRRVREFHPGAQRHVHEVRYVRGTTGCVSARRADLSPPFLGGYRDAQQHCLSRCRRPSRGGRRAWLPVLYQDRKQPEGVQIDIRTRRCVDREEMRRPAAGAKTRLRRRGGRGMWNFTMVQNGTCLKVIRARGRRVVEIERCKRCRTMPPARMSLCVR